MANKNTAKSSNKKETKKQTTKANTKKKTTNKVNETTNKVNKTSKKVSKVEVVKKANKKDMSKKVEIADNSKKYNKYGLLKWIGGLFLVFVILTWLLEAGQFSEAEFSVSGKQPLGLLDLVRVPLETIQNYASYGLLVLIIGGLYGVMKETGAYDLLVNKMSEAFKEHKKLAVSGTVLIFSILSAVTGLQWVLLILVPLFIDFLRKLDYSRLSSLMATIGAILIGNVASIYGFNVSGYSNYYLSLDINKDIFTKIILFIMLVVILILYIIKHNKKELSKEEVALDAKENVSEEGSKKRHVWPLVIIFVGVVAFLLIAGYNWYYGVGFEGFNTIYDSITTDYDWLNKIIGQFIPLGYWTVSEFSIVLVLITPLIAWIYSVKMKDALEAFIKGAKKALAPALYIMFASIIIYGVLSGSNGTNIYNTIANSIINLSGSVNALVMTILSAVGGFFLNDYTYFIGYTVSPLKAIYTDSTMYSFMALIMQSIHGFMMLLLPTSMILVAGLSHVKVNYLDYLKYVWKFLVEVLIVCLVVFVAIAMFM